MDEQGCPRCKTTKYRNPSLKLLVNVCGHSLCESCVDLLFIKGSGACPECGTALRRNNFRLQIFEDSNVEKELDIRKRILRDYNKKEEDFPSLRDYNDYLEMIETIVFNLTNGIDVESTRKMIEHYKRDNKDQIKKNLSKMSKDQEYLDLLIEQEKHESAVRKQIMEEEAAQEKALKKKNKAALIDELIALMDRRLLHIQVPDFIARRPSSIADHAHWKGIAKQSMNIHMLTHLPHFVRLFGPLWNFSCFGFESMNAHLKSMIHGTRHINHQECMAETKDWRQCQNQLKAFRKCIENSMIQKIQNKS